MENSSEDKIAVIEFSEDGNIKQEVRDEDIEEVDKNEDISIEELVGDQLDSSGTIPRENTLPRINVALPSGVNVVIVNGIKIVKFRDLRPDSRILSLVSPSDLVRTLETDYVCWSLKIAIPENIGTIKKSLSANRQEKDSSKSGRVFGTETERFVETRRNSDTFKKYYAFK